MSDISERELDAYEAGREESRELINELRAEARRHAETAIQCAKDYTEVRTIFVKCYGLMNRDIKGMLSDEDYETAERIANKVFTDPTTKPGGEAL